jgi:hypothetical protein
MQYEKAHTAKNALLHPVDDRIVDAGMGGMPPPGQHISTVQDFFGQPVFWLILGSCADHN